MLLERALILIFDYRWYKEKLSGIGLKVPISFITAWGSAGAITLFQGVLKFNKEAQDSLRKANQAEAEAKRMKEKS